MKLAVASEDGVLISHHFGRSRCFLIFEIEDKQIIGRSVRDNSFTAHARGQCQDGQPREHHHGHGAIVEALGDCDAVLCHGMGWRAAEDLKQNGIQAFVIQGDLSPEQAVVEYLAGNLGLAGGFCRCHE
jgi:predicted Fe-Mo cluster-binding NifX family protein